MWKVNASCRKAETFTKQVVFIVTKAAWSIYTVSVTSSYGSLSDAIECRNIDVEKVQPTQESSHVDVTAPCLTSTSLASKVSHLSTKLGLPLQALERIAEKATELLECNGAIVNASGYAAEAKIVSHSGKQPHLVTPKRKVMGTCVMMNAHSISQPSCVHIP